MHRARDPRFVLSGAFLLAFAVSMAGQGCTTTGGSRTSTAAATATATVLGTWTPLPTDTETSTISATRTRTATRSFTISNTRTLTRTSTETMTSTDTFTPTDTYPPGFTPSPTDTPVCTPMPAGTLVGTTAIFPAPAPQTDAPRAFSTNEWWAYPFSATAGTTYYFSVCCNGGTYTNDSWFDLYEASTCTLLMSDDDGCSPGCMSGGLGSEITWNAPASGGYLLRVRGYAWQAITYTLAYWSS